MSVSEVSCRVRYIAMGSHVVVWAATPSMGVRSMTLAADTASSLAGQAGQQDALLSSAAARRVHDELLLPVIQGLCCDEGLSPPTSLRTLPLEIKMLVLWNLSVRLSVSLPKACENGKCTQGIQLVQLQRCAEARCHPDPYIPIDVLMTQLPHRAGWRPGCHSVHMQGIWLPGIGRGAVGGPVQERVSGSA